MSKCIMRSLGCSSPAGRQGGSGAPRAQLLQLPELESDPDAEEEEGLCKPLKFQLKPEHRRTYIHYLKVIKSQPKVHKRICLKYLTI